MSGLAPGTVYQVAIYTAAGAGVGASGINYLESAATSSQQTLFEPPTVETPTVTIIGETSATLGGDIASDGGTDIIEIGVVWDTVSPPESGGTVVNETVGAPYASAPFTLGVSGLPTETLIYFKAFAANSAGTSYSDEASFTTLAPPSSPPVPAMQPWGRGLVVLMLVLGAGVWFQERRFLHDR